MLFVGTAAGAGKALEGRPVSTASCPTLCLRRAEMFSLADDLIKHVEQSALLVRYEFGIADNVDKKHIGNLQLDLLLNLLLNLRKHWGRL